jgi:hypothetical protein
MCEDRDEPNHSWQIAIIIVNTAMMKALVSKLTNDFPWLFNFSLSSWFIDGILASFNFIKGSCVRIAQ